MPQELLNHIHYPDDQAWTMAIVWERYHLTNVNEFYEASNVWQIATERYTGGSEEPVRPYYVEMELPVLGHGREFINMVTFTPPPASDGKPRWNLNGWLAFRSDPAHYGGIVEINYPRNEQVMGSMQFQTILEQGKFGDVYTLWNQQHKSVLFGNTMAIPLGSDILYVEPIYVSTSDSPIPTCRAIAMGYGTKVVWAETTNFAEVLDLLFPGYLGTSSVQIETVVQELKGSTELQYLQEALKSLESWQALTGKGQFDAAGKGLERTFEILRQGVSKEK